MHRNFIISILHWRSLLTSLLLTTCLMGATAQKVLKRKNIDNLTTEELAAYKHAIQLLKDRSAKKPYAKDGYAWQAWVHNLHRVKIPNTTNFTFSSKNDAQLMSFFKIASELKFPKTTSGYPGKCEHGKDLFLFWHRAELYYFEKILQATDPKGNIEDSKGIKISTQNVTIPYWNFTRKPTGERYPLAFEDKRSTLYHENRETAKVNFPFTSRYMASYLIHYSNWEQYGGTKTGTKGGFGNLEAMIHNPMHATYIDGDMASNTTAAYDPIFFSFHCYIDLLLDAWLKPKTYDKKTKELPEDRTSEVTSQNSYLRGEQPAGFDPPNYIKGNGDRPEMGQVKLYLSTQNVGYEYEILPDDDLVSKEELDKLFRLDEERSPIFGKDSKSLLYQLFTTEGTFAPRATKGREVTQDSITIGARFQNQKQTYVYKTDMKDNFQIDVYIHPKGVPFNVTQRQFREKYLANIAVHWGNKTGKAHHGKDGTPTLIGVDITEATQDLYNNNKGEHWIISVNISKL